MKRLRAGLLLAVLTSMAVGSTFRASCAEHGLGLRAPSGSMHERSHHHASESDRGEHGGRHHDTCCCTGDCTVTAPVAVAPAPIVVRLLVKVSEQTRVAIGRSVERPVPAPDRLLPFPNGPPQGTLA
jgi:hypothetical protein